MPLIGSGDGPSAGLQRPFSAAPDAPGVRKLRRRDDQVERQELAHDRQQQELVAMIRENFKTW
jgi:hypothetical protein